MAHKDLPTELVDLQLMISLTARKKWRSRAASPREQVNLGVVRSLGGYAIDIGHTNSIHRIAYQRR